MLAKSLFWFSIIALKFFLPSLIFFHFSEKKNRFSSSLLRKYGVGNRSNHENVSDNKNKKTKKSIMCVCSNNEHTYEVMRM